MVSRYIYVLIALLFLITPLYAVDLSDYDGYITPKFGASINNVYQYTSDNIIWGDVSPSFEKNGGYYNIFEDNEEVIFQTWINSSFGGLLYLVLWFENKNGEYEYSDYLVFSGVAGDFEGYYFSKTITIPANAYGDCFYQWGLSQYYWVGADVKWSKEYTFFTKRGLNTNWKQKRSLSISSTEKLKNGITELNLNKSYMENVHIEYTLDSLDGNLYSYSGTLTDLVFTNEDYTKAYPYFVNEYDGGYFEFNRETSNNTIIDLWINEDINDKQIYMFYDYNFINRAYVYGSATGFQHDRPNNPFTVHQIFNDLRLNETQMINFYNVTGNVDYSYSRSNYISITHQNLKYIQLISPYNLNFNNIEIQTDIPRAGSSELRIDIYNKNNQEIYKVYQTNVNKFKLYNSSGSSVIGTATDIFASKFTAKIYFNGTQRQAEIIEDSNNLYINDTNNFNISKIVLYTRYGVPIKFKYIKELPNNTISYSISNASLTDYAYINFIELNEYQTFINDLEIGGYIEIDNSGLFLCQDTEENILGSININKDKTLETYQIIFPYTITNKTKFLDMNEFNYTCSFISTIGGFNIKSENKTINISSNKIFLDSIKPIQQNNYSSSYISYKINSELNYTGIQTDFSLKTNKINCLQTNNNGKCLIYDFINEVDYYNLSNIGKIFNYNSIKEFSVNSWYLQYYIFERNGESVSTCPRLFYVYKEETNANEEIENYIEWGNSDLISDENYRNDLMWGNPLFYLGSSIYYLATNTMPMDNTTKMFISWIIFLVFNFYTLIFLIFGLFYFKYENIYIALVISLGCISLFTFMNWTPHLLTYVLILCIIYIIGKFLSKE